MLLGEVKACRSTLREESKLGFVRIRNAKAAFLKGFAVEIAAIAALVGALVPVAMKFIEHYWPTGSQTTGG